MIDSYSFGEIIVNGEKYNNDLIIFPDYVKANWWRQEGHSLHPDDLDDVIKAKPEILVIGNGANSVMKVPSETKEYIKSLGIKLIIKKTGKACKTYNKLIEKGKNAVAALHLTC